MPTIIPIMTRRKVDALIILLLLITTAPDSADALSGGSPGSFVFLSSDVAITSSTYHRDLNPNPFTPVLDQRWRIELPLLVAALMADISHPSVGAKGSPLHEQNSMLLGNTSEHHRL